MVVPEMEPLDTEGVPDVQMVIEEPILLFEGTLKEKAVVLPLLSVYQLPLL